jgi:hypothetical protein
MQYRICLRECPGWVVVGEEMLDAECVHAHTVPLQYKVLLNVN